MWLANFDDETYQKIKGSLLRGGNKEEKKTLRDELAMAVMIGNLDNFMDKRINTYKDIAAKAYGIADAMMEEREK